MRLARIRSDVGPMDVVQRGDHWEVVRDIFASELEFTGAVFAVEQARYLPPARPRVVVGMAHNTGPGDRRLPPQAFLKPARTVVGPGAGIVLPDVVGRVDAEAELAVVIGRPARHLTPADALGHVLGVTLANDVTARDLQGSDPLWTSAKSLDGSTPLGPWLETGLDLTDVPITLSVNGAELAAGSTADLARNVVEVLVYITSFMTLGPGDVVLTGAPGEVARIRAGDSVGVQAPSLGRLENVVVEERRPVREAA